MNNVPRFSQEDLFEKTLLMKSPYTRLSDQLEDLPDNVYLNKTTTGCGATHLALNNNINYVVIVPYKSAIYNKTTGENAIKGIIKVMEGVTEDDIEGEIISKYEKSMPCKIMTTYDSFYKVYNAISNLGKLKQFKLCADEAHVLTTLAKIKGKCFNFLYKHFREFGSYVFVTATPNNKNLIPYQIRDVEFVRVSWEVSEKVKVYEQRAKTVRECNNLVIEICKQHLFGEREGNAYIYYNSVNEIIHVITKLKRIVEFNSDNVNIFCAENPYNDKKISSKLGKEFLGGSFDDNKCINFLTSANYESCDILDPIGKTYIIVSSKRNSTALTNHLAVPQACGRLRVSKYKGEARMIICGFDNDTYHKKMDDFLVNLKRLEANAKHMINRSIKTREDGFLDAYEKDLEGFADDPFVIVNEDDSIELNEGAVLSELQVYEAFNSHLVALPNDTEVANTIRVVDDEVIKLSTESRLLIDEKFDFARVMKKYIKAIADNDVDFVERMDEKEPLFEEMVNLLGVDKIKTLGYSKMRLMKAYEIAEKLNTDAVNIRTSLTGINVGEKYTSQYLMERLKKAYSVVGLNDIAIKSTEIERFFVVKKLLVLGEDGKRKNGYKILGDKYV